MTQIETDETNNTFLSLTKQQCQFQCTRAHGREIIYRAAKGIVSSVDFRWDVPVTRREVFLGHRGIREMQWRNAARSSVKRARKSAITVSSERDSNPLQD